ncbi:MAG: hypothetical protein J6Z79_06715 [Clostridia bacterium]|nr:hypothetical protein [Clostridia bacterium]
MKTRLLFIFLALLAVGPLFADFPAFAGQLSAYDLSSLGLIAQRAAFVSAPPTADGVIAPGEYPASTVARFGDGLYLVDHGSGKDLTSDPAGAFSKDLTETTLTSGVSFDGTRAYFFLRCTSPDAGVFGESHQSGLGGAMAVTFSAGFSQSENLRAFSSAWTCTYCFRGDSCIGASGQITRYEPNAVERSFRSWGTASFESYRDASGYLWDGNGYKDTARSKLMKGDKGAEWIVECSVPLEELFLTLPPEQRNEVRNQLHSGSGTVHGCFSAGIALPDNGNSAERLLLETARGMADYDASGVKLFVLPAPLYWRGTPPTRASSQQTAPSVSANASPDFTTATQDPAGEGSDEVKEDDGSFPVPKRQGAGTVDIPEFADEAEFVTETLTEEWNLSALTFPEEGGEMEEYEGEKDAGVSPWIGVIAGAFLALSTVFLFLVIRRMDIRDQRLREEEERKAEERKKTRRAGSAEKAPTPARRKRKRR